MLEWKNKIKKENKKKVNFMDENKKCNDHPVCARYTNTTVPYYTRM